MGFMFGTRLNNIIQFVNSKNEKKLIFATFIDIKQFFE